jgi:hypothetical protein
MTGQLWAMYISGVMTGYGVGWFAATAFERRRVRSRMQPEGLPLVP